MTDNTQEPEMTTEQLAVSAKINQIYQCIIEINEFEPGVSQLLLEGFQMSMNTIQAVALKGDRDIVDVSEQIELVSLALGFNLETLVEDIVKRRTESADMNSDKAVDEATLSFITSDMDDYEKFLAEAKAKDSLDFLSKEL